MIAAANGWDALNTLIDRIPGIVAAVVVLMQHRKIKAIDHAINGRGDGETTMSQDIATARIRNEAQDKAAADLGADAAEGSADRAAGATTDDD